MGRGEETRKVALLLSKTGSPDASVRSPAEKGLLDLRSQPGFRSCLFDIGLTASAPLALRMAAFVALKNALNSEIIQQAAFQSELAHLCPKLRAVALSREERVPGPLFRQVVPAVAALCPRVWKRWQGLFRSIGEALAKWEQPTALLRAASVALETMEALKSAYSHITRGEFTAICAGLTPPSVQAWRRACAMLLSAARAPGAGGAPTLRTLRLAAERLSNLCRICLCQNSGGDGTRGLRPRQRQAAVRVVCEGFGSAVSTLVRIPPDTDPSRAMCALAAASLCLLTECHKLHAEIFSALLPNLGAALRAAAGVEAGSDPDCGDGSRAEMRSRALDLITEFLMGLCDNSTYVAAVQRVFSEANVLALVRLLVEKHLAPTLSDVRKWQMDAEDYWNVRGTHALGRHGHPRPAAEGLFCMLCIRFEKTALGFLLRMLQKAESIFPAAAAARLCASSPDQKLSGASAKGMLLKAGVYHAVGLCPAELINLSNGALRFESWFRSSLSLEIKSGGRGAASAALRPLRERAVWLCGEAVRGGAVPTDAWAAVFSAVCEAIAADIDFGVQMAGCETVKWMLDARPKQVMRNPAVCKAVARLCTGMLRLLGSARGLEAKLTVTSAVSAAVRALPPGGGVPGADGAFVSMIQKHFAPLWRQAASEKSPHRAGLLEILCGLAEHLGARSKSLMQFFGPVLQGTLPNTARDSRASPLAVASRRLLLFLACAQAPKPHPAVARMLLGSVELLGSVFLQRDAEQLNHREEFLEISGLLRCAEVYALLASPASLAPVLDRVAEAVTRVFSRLFGLVFRLKEYLSARRRAGAFRASFGDDSPWADALETAAQTLEALAQVVEPARAVQLFGTGALLPVAKFLATQGLKPEQKGPERLSFTLPEYDAHIRRVTTVCVRLASLLVHRWGRGVAQVLSEAGGTGATGAVVALFLRHYVRMDGASQRIALLALGKLLQGQVPAAATRVREIAKTCRLPLRPDVRRRNEDPLDAILLRLRAARRLTDPQKLDAKTVQAYVEQQCRATASQLANPRSPRPLGLSQSAATSPVTGPIDIGQSRGARTP